MRTILIICFFILSKSYAKPTLLTTPLSLKNKYYPFEERKEKLLPKIGYIKTRILKSTNESIIEPFYLPINLSEYGSLHKIAQNFAREGFEKKVEEKLKHAKIVTQRNKQYVIWGKEFFLYTNFSALQNYLAASYREPSLISKKLSGTEKAEILLLVKNWIPNHTFTELKEKLNQNENIPMDPYLLPIFAQKSLRKYSLFRGPNCFHASLTFDSSLWAKSDSFNIRQETFHHKEMINNDELLRILQKYFYPIDLTTRPIQYGDIIVFFEKTDSAIHEIEDHRFLKHAAVFLFNNYVFSKGSKSANSPYLIKTLEEEWALWQKHTQNMGVIAFRKLPMRVTERVKNLTEWLY